MSDHPKRIRTERSSQWLTVGERLGDGAEGAVYGLRETQELAVKLRLDAQPLSHREVRRLRALIDLGLPEQPTNSPRLLCAWPRELVLDATDRPLGFVMRRAGSPVRLAAALSPRGREQIAPNLSFAAVSTLAADIAALVAALHALGIVVCDLNERGILLLRDGSVMLIDLDSVQFVDRSSVGYLSPLYSEEYLAPELNPGELNGKPRTVEHDRYALSYLLFRVQMVGFEPYTGRRKDGKPNDLAQQSRDGAYAYGEMVSDISPPLKAPSIKVLSSEVRGLFEQTFIEGASDPSRRVPASTFEQALRRQTRALVHCNGPRTHLTLDANACEWCRWEQRVGISQSHQAPLRHVFSPSKRARAASPNPRSPRAPASPAKRCSPQRRAANQAGRLRAIASAAKTWLTRHIATLPALSPRSVSATPTWLRNKLLIAALVVALLVSGLILLATAVHGATAP